MIDKIGAIILGVLFGIALTCGALIFHEALERERAYLIERIEWYDDCNLWRWSGGEWYLEEQAMPCSELAREYPNALHAVTD